MGKKLSPASLKISKNNQQKKQLNSLIKVLRPKVYITDSSNFKQLVQELTGNGNRSTITISPPTSKPEAIEKTPVINIDQDYGSQSESNMQELSIDSSDSCNQAWDQIYLDQMTESSVELSSDSVESSDQASTFINETKQAWDQIYFDETALETLSTNQHADLFAYQDLESWLLDMEQFPSYSYPQIEQQQVCIYDYELSGLL